MPGGGVYDQEVAGRDRQGWLLLSIEREGNPKNYFDTFNP
jgi:hypothetical protein